MKREPTQEERDRITRAVVCGDRVEATTLYMSITGCGLAEAQKFIAAVTTDVEAAQTQRLVSYSNKRGCSWMIAWSIRKGRKR